MTAIGTPEDGEYHQKSQPVDRPGNVVPVGSHRHQADIFQAAVQLTRMPMTLSDPNQDDNPLIFVNPAFVKQTGYDEAEVVGRNCRFLQGPGTDQDTVRRIRQALEARETLAIDIYNYRKDGRGFWNNLFISPIYDAAGQLVHFFASQVDVTELKEAAARQRQHLDAVGSMASNVAHTFNNLMTVAVGNLNQAGRVAVSENQRLQLTRAEEAARAAGRLTQQMLSFAQRQFLQEQPSDLNGLVGSLDDLIRQMVGVDVSVEFNLAQHPVHALLDARQFELALMAIVQNAADAMPDGGTIAVGTREYTSWDAAFGQAGRLWAELSVSDHGVGMAPEIAGRATEPFFSTKPNGTGLGLSMVQGFAEQSHGRLSMETEPGEGTTVRLAFPKHI